MLYDLILKGGTIFTPGGLISKDIAVKNGKIAAIGEFEKHQADACLACDGLTILPGAIDTQVHFREPGLEGKEDLESGSRAAVLGGITAVFEMPNTNPPTDTAEALAGKLARAKNRMWCDHAFYIGATAHNFDNWPDWKACPDAPASRFSWDHQRVIYWSMMMKRFFLFYNRDGGALRFMPKMKRD